jgi:hypothetical protein
MDSLAGVDRRKEKDPSRVALIWEKDEPAGQYERLDIITL